MNKIVDGLLYGIGATIAFHIMGFLLSAAIWLAFMVVSMFLNNGSSEIM